MRALSDGPDLERLRAADPVGPIPADLAEHPSARAMLAAITRIDADSVTGPIAVPVRGRRPRGRTMVLGLAGAAVLAGGAYGAVLWSTDAPLRGTDYGFLDRLDTYAAPSEDTLARAQRFLAPFTSGEHPLVYAQAVTLGRVEGLDVVVVPTEGAGRYCAAVMDGGRSDGPVSTLCTDARNAVYGLSIVEHQTEPGGLDAPRTYVGIAPDGVASVRALGRSVPVVNNLFGFRVAPGGPLGVVVYVLDDGTEARVRVTN